MSGTGAFVYSTRVAATGSVADGPNRRIRGLWIAAGAAGNFTFTDGNGGATVLNISSAIGQGYLPIGAGTEGIRCLVGIYCSAIPASSSVTVIWD